MRLRQGTRDAAHASGSWAASGSGRAPVSPLDTPSGPVTAPAPVRGARLDLSDASLKALSFTEGHVTHIPACQQTR